MKRRVMILGRFNLIDEPWIKVIIDKKGTTQLASLADVFENTSSYIGLGGDMKIQDFAVLRLLLAILHTVYSRFDGEDEGYDCLELDDKYRPLNDIEDEDEYVEGLESTWLELWESGEFTSIISTYLNTWYDRFYLFDNEYPFYQLTESELNSFEISSKKPGKTAGKMFNRTITESNNKTNLFAPRNEENKNKLQNDEVARWLVLFQGCVGTSDKTKFIIDGEKIDGSKGWIYDLGGIWLEGNNLFETLMLNLVLIHPEEKYRYNHQTPSWEKSGKENALARIKESPVTNLAELYTVWARALVIDDEHTENEDFQIALVKLPDIEHRDNYLEPMTLWRFNKQRENINTYTPRKHTMGQGFWRSFGNVFISNQEEARQPIIIDWLFKIQDHVQEVRIESVSMIDDGNATSWVPSNQYYDTLTLHDYVLFDYQTDEGWIYRINDEVELTKEVIEKTLRNYYRDIMELRNIERAREHVAKYIEEAYFDIDSLFRNWLNSIQEDDEKNDMVTEWRSVLYQYMVKKGEEMLKEASHRDYKGIMRNEKMMNIATIYNKYIYWLNRQLKKE